MIPSHAMTQTAPWFYVAQFSSKEKMCLISQALLLTEKTLSSKTRPLPKGDIRGVDSLEHFISDI